MHVAGGATEAHFSFFVVMVLLTLYEDWTVFALAVVYTLLHHGVLGMIDPGGGLLRASRQPLGMGGHSRGLRRGGRLELTADRLETIRQAAELHDVGKVGIPDAILSKPGPLDADEWTFMRRHTVIGERIVRTAASLAPVAQLVRSSHERYDGTGYPLSLIHI